MTSLKNLNAFFGCQNALRVEIAPNRPREQGHVLADDGLETNRYDKGMTTFVTYDAISQVFQAKLRNVKAIDTDKILVG